MTRTLATIAISVVLALSTPFARSEQLDASKCSERMRKVLLLSETMTDSAESTMSENIISAEITPVENFERMAASALQQRGFRIHRVDKTISVDGPESLWTSVFGVSFESVQSAPVLKIPGSEKVYRRSIPGTIYIPENLKSLIKDVGLIEPPQFY